MAINGVSSNNSVSATPQAAPKASPQNQFLKDVSDLGKALKSGNLSDAKNAVSSLQQGGAQQNGTQQTGAVAQTSQTNNQNQIRDAVKQVDKALKSGDVNGARQGYNRLQEEAKAQQQKAPQVQREQNAARIEDKRADDKNAQRIDQKVVQQQTEVRKVDTRQAEAVRHASVEAAQKVTPVAAAKSAAAAAPATGGVGTRINTKA